MYRARASVVESQRFSAPTLSLYLYLYLYISICRAIAGTRRRARHDSGSAHHWTTPSPEIARDCLLTTAVTHGDGDQAQASRPHPQ